MGVSLIQEPVSLIVLKKAVTGGYLYSLKITTMKTFLSCGLLALIIACGMSACSKKNDNPASKAITAQDLQSYYIVNLYTDQGKQRLSVIYFPKDTGAIKAWLDMNGVRRAYPVALKGDQFTFDGDANGVLVYTFTLKRDSAGNVAIASADIKHTGYPDTKMNASQIIKVSAAPVLTGKIFSYTIPGSDDDTYIHFDAGSTLRFDDYNGIVGPYSYYSIGNGIGWKCEDPASGGSTMGVVGLSSNGNTPMMLIQTTVPMLDPSRIHTAELN